MSLLVNRYACMKDLNNYFDKKGLLGGLTTLEQETLRGNIGIENYTGEGGQSTPVSKTYEELYYLVQTSTLVVGARYIITDFQTIYSSNVLNNLSQKITWGTSINTSPVYNLVIIANTNSKFDSRVTILEHPDWIVEYNITKEILPDGVITKGKITYLKDTNSNSAYYDFKNIRFRRTALELTNSNLSILGNYLDLYTFSDINGDTVIENSGIYTTKYNTLKEDCWNNIFIGDTYDNIIESNCVKNTFIRGCHDCIIEWGSTNNIFNEVVCYTKGAIYNKIIQIGNAALSMSITKTINKVIDSTIVSYLDPTTYSYQIIEL